MSILAAHQPNFAPWPPYFDKMNKSDVFVTMINCQFEKNGFQNRAKVGSDWWTVPVQKGLSLIKDKKYTNGESLVKVNMAWIHAIALTLGIDTSKIRLDFETDRLGTERIIELCQRYDCDQYLTNPDATEKYLDEKKLNSAGIELVPCDFPYKKSIFEAFSELGVDKLSKLLRREKGRMEAILEGS